MVVVLGDQLLHLTYGVFPSLTHMLGDIWYFSPDHDSIFITEMIEILVMLIVGQSDCIGSDFHYQGHVLFMVFLGYCVSLVFSILMAAHSP